MKRVDPRQLVLVFPMCSRCIEQPSRSHHRYCLHCFAEYMRDWRKTHPLTELQRIKDRARSYANAYKQRGKINPQSCIQCGVKSAEMHHADYSRPLDVVWLCRPCHLAHHKELVSRETERAAA